MSNVHYLDIPFRKPLNTHAITDELIDILYDFMPERISHWSLKLAQAQFNERQAAGHSTWLDRVQIYVGLPTWVVSEEQMFSEAMAHLKCPLGLLLDLDRITETSLQCAIPYTKTDTLTKRPYQGLLHSLSISIITSANRLDEDIKNRTGDFRGGEDEFERLITDEKNHIREKKEFLVKRMKRMEAFDLSLDVIRNSLVTCKQLADGNEETIKAFLGLSSVTQKAVVEAKEIYSQFDMHEFFEWASHHFGLDDYYEDGEDLIFQIKRHLGYKELNLPTEQDLKFLSSLVGRTSCV